MASDFEFSGAWRCGAKNGDGRLGCGSYGFIISSRRSRRPTLWGQQLRAITPATDSPGLLGESVVTEQPNANDEDRADIIASVRFLRDAYRKDALPLSPGVAQTVNHRTREVKR